MVADPAEVPRPSSSRSPRAAIGWVPYFLEKADFVYDHHHRWTGADFGDRFPSQVFREHVQTCFIDDDTGLRNREWIGDRHDHVGVRLPALRLHLADIARGDDEVVAAPSSPTTTPTRSRGRTRAAGTSSTRSSTARARSAPWVRCEPRPATSTRPHASTATSSTHTGSSGTLGQFMSRGNTAVGARRHRRDLGEHGAIPGSADHRQRRRVGHRPGNGAPPPRRSRNRARGRRRRRRPRAHAEDGGVRRCRRRVSPRAASTSPTKAR